MAQTANNDKLLDKADAGHDLNNVLSRIVAYAERAMRYADDAAQTRAILSELISTALEHASPDADHDNNRR